MSRYTEIETAAHHAYEDYLCEGSQDFVNGISIGFRRGAEWADKTMLDKACEWLRDLGYDRYIEMHEDNIEDFRKAMEE